MQVVTLEVNISMGTAYANSVYVQLFNVIRASSSIGRWCMDRRKLPPSNRIHPVPGHLIVSMSEITTDRNVTNT